MTVKLVGSSSGSMSIAAPATTTSGAHRTITLNDTYGGDGTFVTANSSGNVGIGTASPDQILHLNKTSGDTYLRLQGGTNQGTLIHATDGTLLGGFVSGGAVGGGASDIAMRVESNNTMLFATGTSIRMRIDPFGHVLIGCSNTDSNNSTGLRLFNNGAIHATRSSEYSYVGRRSDSDGGLFLFRRDSSNVGSISVNSSSTAYNTSSDYRLKENQTAITDGITRLKTLKPYRFNWKVDPDTKVDGFFAHEVTAVPEAISGTKDAVATEDSEEAKKGDPIYQQIDQSKLVPLLTAALQEAVAKIETLETKVAALEAK